MAMSNFYKIIAILAVEFLADFYLGFKEGLDIGRALPISPSIIPILMLTFIGLFIISSIIKVESRFKVAFILVVFGFFINLVIFSVAYRLNQNFSHSSYNPYDNSSKSMINVDKTNTRIELSK